MTSRRSNLSADNTLEKDERLTQLTFTDLWNTGPWAILNSSTTMLHLVCVLQPLRRHTFPCVLFQLRDRIISERELILQSLHQKPTRFNWQTNIEDGCHHANNMQLQAPKHRQPSSLRQILQLHLLNPAVATEKQITGSSQDEYFALRDHYSN